MNKKNRCECRGIPRIWLFSLLLLTGLYFHMEVEAQLMSITGKVMQKETGKGVARVELLLGEVNTGDYYFSKTDRNGNFRVRKVPHGIYQISEAYINATCPEALLVSEIPDIVEVLPGKNIGGLKIYLKRGAVISGYIFAADGVTPLKGVEVSADPRRYGKTWNVYTDARGKYVINGLDSGFKILYASINGSALESTNLDVKPHDNFDNVNFNLGRGTVTVKGKVVSDKDNTAIENAIVFLTHRDINDNYSAGFATTDGNGEYSLYGLKFPGTFELSVVHDEFEVDGTYVLLEKGDNNLNLQLSPQDEIATIRMANDNNTNSGSMIRYAALSSSSSSSRSNTENCGCDAHYAKQDFDNLQNEMCERINRKRDCIGDDAVLKCMQYRCKHRNYKINCVSDCPKGAAGRSKALNSGRNGETTIDLCTNNKKHTRDEIMVTIFHELFHICDRGGDKNKTTCADWRAYRATFCMYTKINGRNNSNVMVYSKKYRQKCKECLRDGINCTDKKKPDPSKMPWER